MYLGLLVWSLGSGHYASFEHFSRHPLVIVLNLGRWLPVVAHRDLRPGPSRDGAPARPADTRGRFRFMLEHGLKFGRYDQAIAVCSYGTAVLGSIAAIWVPATL